MICGLSNSLANDNEVTVCTIVSPNPNDKFYRELAPEVKKETIGRVGEGKQFKEMYRIAKFIKEGKFDIVHIHGFFYYYALAILLYHRKTCFCYTVHSNAAKENNPWDLRILFFKRFCFKKGWINPITISPTSQESFYDLYGCESKMIPNGIVRPQSKETSDVSIFRKTDNTRVFIHASRICPEKNQVMLCKVFDQLIRAGKDISLIIAGPIHHHEIFEEMQSYFSDRIQYIGERDDIPALLCTADGMCLTSFYEGLPVILLESLAAGCIPICTAVGGILDVIQDGENGILSKEVSESDYLIEMNRYLELDGNAIQKMKEACIQTSLNYDINITAQSYQAFYEDLIKNRRA